VTADDGRVLWDAPPKPVRILTPDQAETILGMLEGAVSGRRATGKNARVEGWRVAGKTGSYQADGDEGLGWFVGIAPVEDPRWAIAVAVEAPKFERFVGGVAAAPLFSRFVAEALGARGDQAPGP
jgi:cell division protein FtsI (penicillin-binding protein 3)